MSAPVITQGEPGPLILLIADVFVLDEDVTAIFGIDMTMLLLSGATGKNSLLATSPRLRGSLLFSYFFLSFLGT